MKKIVFILIFLVSLFFSESLLSTSAAPENVALIEPVAGEQYKSAPITPAPPARILIPRLNVSAHVEKVGKDNKGRMDIPSNVSNSGWYSPGVVPGKPGNTVIAGHINTPSFTPSIFSGLNSLETGDDIRIVDEVGRTWTFTVTRLEEYPADSFPVGPVFGPAEIAGLNLITCSGTWEKNRQQYSDRLVVFSRLKKA